MAIRSVPPYWPISSRGVMTGGFGGSRSSTGGRVPAATIAASIGASLYLPDCIAVPASAAGCALVVSSAPLANSGTALNASAATRPTNILCMVPPWTGASLTAHPSRLSGHRSID